MTNTLFFNGYTKMKEKFAKQEKIEILLPIFVLIPLKINGKKHITDFFHRCLTVCVFASNLRKKNAKR
jgi:hypothetical protein